MILATMPALSEVLPDTTVTVSTFVTNLGTFVSGLMDWAGDVVEFILSNPYLETVIFLVPLCGIGIAAIRRLIRL